MLFTDVCRKPENILDDIQYGYITSSSFTRYYLKYIVAELQLIIK